MGKSKAKNSGKISSKKKFQQQIMANLITSLPGLQEILGEKKFNSRIKKAAKLLSDGIKEKDSREIKKEKKRVSKKKQNTPGPAAEK